MTKPSIETIEKVLAGIASKEDARYVAKWFATDDGLAYLSKQMEIDAAKIKAGTEDFLVNHRIETEKIYLAIKKKIRRRFLLRNVWWAAALVVLFVTAGSIFIRLNSRVDLFGSTQMQEFAVPRGERLQMMFQDGTRVYLNADSKIKYPQKFGLDERKIYLEGEAYFIVTPNAKRPFVVDVGCASIKVLGTSFNVEAYPQDSNITLLLDEGKINMQPTTGKDFTLIAGDKLVYNKNEHSGKISKISESSASKWKSNIISFNNEPLSTVVEKLGRWYDVEFEIADTAALKYRYTITSENTLLEKVLQDLEKIAPVKFEYDVDAKKVVVREEK